MNMDLLDDKPKRPGFGDIFSAFVIILSIAFGLKAYSEISEYADLRAHGMIVEGYWVSSYTNPGDAERYVIYYFVLDGKTYNTQQILDDTVQYTKSGDPVSIVYLPDDPNRSRIAGTATYDKTSVLKLILNGVLAVLSLQYFIAYYTERPAWIFKLISTWKRIRGNGRAGTLRDRHSFSQEEIQNEARKQKMRKRRIRRYIKRGIIAGASIAIMLVLGAAINSIQKARLRARYEDRAERIATEATVQVFDGVEMVLVPAGCFYMGNDGTGGRQCFDEPFWIDRYEVTNEQYDSIGCMETSIQPNQPRNCISWVDAHNFCESRGARLPTEAEWEYAARGPDNSIYPWGNDFVADNIVYLDNSEGQTAAVGSRSSGISWSGAYDLSGNLWEWTSTLYRDYPYDADDGRELYTTDGSHRVLRGGSFDNTENFLRAALRFGGGPGYVDDIRGFRCARSYSNPIE
jgi:formylglycine-generating enzyme required for sulfatase activity